MRVNLSLLLLEMTRNQRRRRRKRKKRKSLMPHQQLVLLPPLLNLTMPFRKSSWRLTRKCWKLMKN